VTRAVRALGLATAFVAVNAWAQPSVRLITTGELPFTAGELADAVALRLPLADDGFEVGVAPAGADAVRVTLRAKERLVALEGRKGPAAARRVALAVVDLAGAEAAPDTLPPEPELAPAPRSVTPKPAPPAIVLRRAPAAWLGLLPTVTPAALGVAADASLRLRGPVRATLQAGVRLGGPSAAVGGVDVSMARLALRAGVAFARGPVELRLEGVVEPYRVSGAGDGVDVAHGGALAGAGATVVARLPRGFFAGGGVDLFANRADFRVRGKSAFTTARVAPWLGVGWAWRVK
jgi:hypothetical protein